MTNRYLSDIEIEFNHLVRNPYTKAEAFLSYVLTKDIVLDLDSDAFIKRWGCSIEIGKRWLKEFKQWSRDHADS